MKKSTVNAALALALAAALTGCAQPYVPENGTVPAGTDAVSGSAASAEASSEQTAASDPSADNALNGNNHHKITTGGEYTLKGNITKRVKIDANGGDVHIILDNVVISTKNEPAIYVKSAGTVRITLADGTSNSLSVV
ncbi:MAG: carbohydrate-binding domain-containing protein, partial [Oscillospiraceae bacterium]|nr:carbohydrate-binding domain-containing protein [Oscillospiraceae bacterium]